jgi:hypothetical protein
LCNESTFETTFESKAEFNSKVEFNYEAHINKYDLSINKYDLSMNKDDLSDVILRAGRTRIVFDYSVSSSFDLHKGRKVSTYKGSFFFRRTCFSKDYPPLFDNCRFILVPVLNSSIYPLEEYESFYDVAVLIKKGLRQGRRVRSKNKYLKSGIGFINEQAMHGYRFIVSHKRSRLYAVKITSVAGDIIDFDYFELKLPDLNDSGSRG